MDTGRQWFKARYGLDAQETSRVSSFCAHAILTPLEPLAVPDASADPRFTDNPVVLGPPFIRSYVGIPLVNPEGQALGTLCVIGQEPRAIGPEIVATLSGRAKSVMTTLELRRAMSRVRDFALTDPLTGLPNRAAFNQALDKAIALHRRHGQPFGLMYLDLDRFKKTNDTQGHDLGDTVLQAAADVLRATVRQEDVAARLGGDEFALVLAGYDQAEGTIVGDRLRAALSERMSAGGWDVTASIGGVSVAVPAERCDVLTAADAAMYIAKAGGGDRMHWRSFKWTYAVEARQHTMHA